MSFFEKLLDLDKIALYKHPELHITDGVLNPLTQEKSPDVYTRIFSYFYSKNNSGFIEIKLKKKQILNAFSDKKKEIVNFVKEKNIGYNTEEDLLNILTYYNSL